RPRHHLVRRRSGGAARARAATGRHPPRSHVARTLGLGGCSSPAPASRHAEPPHPRGVGAGPSSGARVGIPRGVRGVWGQAIHARRSGPRRGGHDGRYRSDVAMTDETARVLVVEDNRDTSALLRDLLEAEGYQVESVGTGEAALEALEVNPETDLLVLDL